MLIGLHGKARSGKDTALEAIREACGGVNAYDYAEPPVHRSFADLLKKSAAAAIGISLADVERIKTHGKITVSAPSNGDIEALHHQISGRRYLQNYGTEAHRDIFGKNFWLDACIPPDFEHEGQIVVVTDVRFDNEAKRIRDVGGKIWRIRRPEVDTGDEHGSEQVLPYRLVDRVIDNVASLERYKTIIKAELEREIRLDKEKQLLVASYG